MPDPGQVFAYNRFMYTYGNPMAYTDPSENDPWWIGDRIPSWPVNYPDQREYVADYLHQSGLGPQYSGSELQYEQNPWGPSQDPGDNWIDLGFDWLLQHGPEERVFGESTHIVENLMNHPGMLAAREDYMQNPPSAWRVYSNTV